MPRLGTRLGVRLGEALDESLAGLLPVTNGLVSHLRSDKGITLNGTDVSGWADQTPGAGSANDATQATAADQPAYNTTDANFNGHPSLDFDGAAHHLDWDGVADDLAGDDVAFSVFVVSNVDAGSVQAMLSWTAAGGAQPSMRLLLNTSAPQFQRYDDIGSPATPEAGSWDTSPHVHSVVFSGTAVDWYIDGSAQISSGAADVGTCTFGIATIGALRDAGTPAAWFNGQIAEVALFNRALPSTERAKIEQHLLSRYGL